MNIIIVIISLYLDGIVSIIASPNSFYIPHLLLTTLFFIYPKYKNREKTYNVILIISGLLYDLLYTNLLFFHAIIFFIIGKLIMFLNKNFSQNIIMQIISLIITITIYIFLIAGFLLFFKTTHLNIIKINKIIFNKCNIFNTIKLYPKKEGIIIYL